MKLFWTDAAFHAFGGGVQEVLLPFVVPEVVEGLVRGVGDLFDGSSAILGECQGSGVYGWTLSHLVDDPATGDLKEPAFE